MRRQNASLFSLVALVAAVATAQQPTAPFSFTQLQSSGMVGITGSQTARLNVLNLSATTTTSPGTGCSAQVTFLDDQSNVLKTGTVTPDAGKSGFVDYPSTVSVRQQIRVTISISRPTQMAPTGDSSVAIPYFYCSLVPTLEVFDKTSSITAFVVSDFHYVYAYPMPLMGGGERSRPDAIDLNRGVGAER